MTPIGAYVDIHAPFYLRRSQFSPVRGPAAWFTNKEFPCDLHFFRAGSEL